MGKVARANRERTIEQVLAIFRGRGGAGDTTGNSPGTKWVALNAIAEHLDYGRRYTSRTNQIQRSFEATALKQGRWTWCWRPDQEISFCPARSRGTEGPFFCSQLGMSEGRRWPV